MRLRLAIGALVALVALGSGAPAGADGRSLELEFRGQAIMPTGTTFAGTTVGGLSSITYDRRRDAFYTVSDDQIQARFYTVALEVRDGRLTDNDVRFVDVTADRSIGVRPNLGFESAGVHGRHLFVGAENALYQDGPAATIANGSPARILRYILRTRRVDREWVYVTDPVAEPPVPATQFSVNGLVELLPLDDHHLIAMERSFSVGAPDTGNTIKLYAVTLGHHTAQKTLLLDLDELGIPLDNVEGMTFGPQLRNGRRSVVLVSDNNFAPAQFTQFLLFALDR